VFSARLTQASLPPPFEVIVGGADADKFAMDQATGALTFIEPANFEMPADVGLDNRYEVIVEVTDGDLNSQQAISVRVIDVGGETITGSKKGETVRASDEGESVVRGGKGNDVLLGSEFDDDLGGGKGNDKLYGGSGRDILDGGVGKDLLHGGPHGDLFRFSTKLGSGNVDKVKQFSPYYDRIALDTEVFTTLHRGVLDADAFRIGKSAVDREDRIMYDQKSGALFYDPDGIGGSKKIKFAVLVDKPDTVHEGDFLVI